MWNSKFKYKQFYITRTAHCILINYKTMLQLHTRWLYLPLLKVKYDCLVKTIQGQSQWYTWHIVQAQRAKACFPGRMEDKLHRRSPTDLCKLWKYGKQSILIIVKLFSCGQEEYVSNLQKLQKIMYSLCLPPLSPSLKVLKAILWIKHTELSNVMLLYIWWFLRRNYYN